MQNEVTQLKKVSMEVGWDLIESHFSRLCAGGCVFPEQRRVTRPGPDKTDNVSSTSTSVDSFMKLLVSNLRPMVPYMTKTLTLLTHVHVM